MPNSSHTSEYYDSCIPSDLVGFSQFERVLPYAETSCVEFTSTETFPISMPLIDLYLTTWETIITIPLTIEAVDGRWVNCTVTAGWANATSTCDDTKCETKRTSENITPFDMIGMGISTFFAMHKPEASTVPNVISTWILGGDILKGYYPSSKYLPAIPTPESIADRLTILGTVLTRATCDVNSPGGYKKSSITSSYIESSYYQYRVLWKWPFYVLAGCIFALWLLCIVAMWLAPESRVLNIDWLLNQYISRHHRGYLSGADLLPDHQGVVYQVYDDNAEGDVGNIIITSKESRRLGKYDRVVQDKLYQ
ncbi:hypothetical protein MBANPS3_008851 [Mucor bainieri]